MGRAHRPKPARLAEKLLEIRTKLDLSQNGMIRRMGLNEEVTREEISTFERSVRVPPLTVLLEYARAAGSGALVEVLIDDSLELPDKLPVSDQSKKIAPKRSRHKNM